jgi:ribosomal protein S18 acetylase RimI-like enzyme
MNIRLVRPEEYDAIGEIVAGAYRTVPGRPATPAYDPILRDTRTRAKAADVLVAIEDDGTPLGSVTYVDGPGEYAVSEDPDEAGVRMLAVAPQARGRGVGGALMQACIDRARASGRKQLVLSTEQSMTAARRLYERLGFQRVPERDRQPVPGLTLLAYALVLGAHDGAD